VGSWQATTPNGCSIEFFKDGTVNVSRTMFGVPISQLGKYKVLVMTACRLSSVVWHCRPLNLSNAAHTLYAQQNAINALHAGFKAGVEDNNMPPLAAEPPQVPGAHQMPPHLLLGPVFHAAEAASSVPDPEVVHNGKSTATADPS